MNYNKFQKKLIGDLTIRENEKVLIIVCSLSPPLFRSSTPSILFLLLPPPSSPSFLLHDYPEGPAHLELAAWT